MITFDGLKKYALSGRSTDIGKLQGYWRFHYEPTYNMVKIYHRGYSATKNDTDSAKLIFSITSDSECQIHIDNASIDSTFISFTRRELHLRFALIPYTQRHKFIDIQYTVNGYYYKANVIIISLITSKAITAPTYRTEKIDKTFNQLITNCSKTFRHEFTATYNLLQSSYEDLMSKGNPLSSKELWRDLTSETLNIQLIYNWLYTAKDYRYRCARSASNDIDVRKLLQIFINAHRKLWAKTNDKLIYTDHEQ